MKRTHSEGCTGSSSGGASPNLGSPSVASGPPMMVYAWGHGPNGELGLAASKDDAEAPVLRPQRVRRFGTRVVREVVCGRQHTLVLLANGCVYSCGSNDFGQLGQDKSMRKLEQVTALSAHEIRTVACGQDHSLALSEAGQVFSWGSNQYGQLGCGSDEDSRLRPKVVKTLAAMHVVQIACGAIHCLALVNNGDLYSWGDNSYGQLGTGSSTQGTKQSSPTRVLQLAGVPLAQVACGGSHSLALTPSGTIFAWGHNSFGQLGMNDQKDRYHPIVLKALRSQKIKYICCGENHTAALTADGGVFTFGNGTYGQLGHGVKSNEILPRRISELMGSVITQLACGRCHTLVYGPRVGRVYAFGLGGAGQLGQGNLSSTTVPTPVLGPWNDVVHPAESERTPSPQTSQCLPGEDSEISWSQCLSDDASCPSEEGTPPTLSAPAQGRITPDEVIEADLAHSEAVDEEDLPTEESSKAAAIFAWSTLPPPSSPTLAAVLRHSSHSACRKLVGFFFLSGWLHSCSNLGDPLVVHRIVSGGDRCFLLCHENKADAPRPLDFRFHSKDSQLLRLDNDLLEQLPFFPANEQVPQELLSYLETIFASCACLNASYLNEDGSHFNCSELNPGVDLEAARHGFRCIQDAKHSSIGQVVSTCLEELVRGLTNSPTDIEAMRVLLLLPLCHLFRDPANHLASLVGKYCLCVTQLKPRPAAILEKWWSLLREPQFEDLVGIFKECIIYVLGRESPTKQNHGHLKLALDVLAKLNVVNREAAGLVPYEHFYIPAVTEKVDVQLDYIQWIQTSRMQRTNKVYFCDYPFVFNAQAKTLILQTDSHIQMQQAMETACQQTFASLILPVVPPSNPYLVLYVGRENIVNDTLNQLADQSAADLKKPLKVQFHGEDAVDAGGEFFLLLLKEILDPKYGMFTEYPESRCIWFNTQSFEEDVMYYLIGIVCGLAIYNFTIIALPFPLVLYKKLLKQNVTLKDLRDLSPTLAKGLQDLLNYEGDDLENVFYLTFEVSVEHYGHTMNHELKKGGHHIKVTRENRQEYVDLYVDFLLNASVRHCFEAFSQGFYKVCSSKSVNLLQDLFHAQELMILVVGSENYDWADLEKNTEYKNGYNPNHPTIRMFWRVFHGLDYEEKKKFLLFLTGSDRIPILGMSEIKIILQPMKVDDDHLPVAHTCFNLLDLPMYSTEEVMREKLRLAIQNAQGFGLV
ncbi:unnamed protein product [Ixodes hexagonus]